MSDPNTNPNTTTSSRTCEGEETKVRRYPDEIEPLEIAHKSESYVGKKLKDQQSATLGISTSATGPVEESAEFQSTLPTDREWKPVIHQSARALVTDKVEPVLNEIYQIINDEARRNYVQVTRVEVSSFSDPDDNTDELVVTQWVRVSPRQALVYWDRLANAIQTWTRKLPPDLEEIANERVALSVRSDEGRENGI